MIIDWSLFVFFPLTRVILIWLSKPFFAQGFVGDSSVHFSIFKHVRKSNSRYIDQYLISPKPMCYPVMFHKTFRFLDPEYLQKKSYIPNLILYSIFIPLACLIIKNFSFNSSTFNNSAIITVLLFEFNLWYVERKNIAYLKFSERLMARLGTSFTFLFLYIFLENSSTIFFLAALVTGTISILSSIFARQVFVFVIPFISILYSSVECFVFIPIIFLLGLLWDGKYFRDALINTVITWKIYKTRTKKSKTVLHNLSNYFKFKLFLEHRGFKSKLKYVLKSEPFSLLTYPNFIFTLFCIGFADLKFLAPFILIYLVTSTNQFNHLGESIRYLEYGLTFIVPILLLKQPEYEMSLFIGFNMVTVIAYAIFKFFSFKELNDQLGIFIRNSKIEEDSVVFPVSMRIGADLCARGKFKSFWWQPGIISNDIYEDFVLEYPYLRPELIKSFHVDYILVDLLEDQKKDWNYDFEKYTLVQSNEYYKLYKT